MQSQNLLLPLNDGVPQTVNTATGAPIPTSLTGLTSDPYRGLEAGGLLVPSAALPSLVCEPVASSPTTDAVSLPQGRPLRSGRSI